MNIPEIECQASDLILEVKDHKREIRSHREALQIAAKKLVKLREWCEANGIDLIIEPPGAGDIHGSATNRNRRQAGNGNH